MKRWICAIAFALPWAVSAQVPIPLLPDWILPSQKSAQLLHQTQVTLAGNNYNILEPNVIGRSRGFKLLGLISFRGASHTEAMSRLYHRAGVEQGRPQALANVLVESSSTYFILFSIPKVTIRADLIEFTGDEPPDEEMNDTSPVLLGARKAPHLLKRR